MGNNTIEKKIKVSVDAKQWEALLKSIKGSEAFQKSILEIQKEISKTLDVINKKQKANNKEEKENLKNLKEEKTLLKEINEIKERYNKQKAKNDFELELEKKNLEKPRKNILENLQKYKGISGAFKSMADQAQEEGDTKKDEFDRRIFDKKQERDELYKKLGDTNLSKDERNQVLADLENKDKEIAGIEKDKSKSIGDTKTQVAKFTSMAKAAEGVDKALHKLGKAAISIVTDPLKKLGEGFKAALHDILEFRTGVATFNTANSLITNSSAREQQLKYGLSASQNYGFTKAKELLNIQSDEDLMYMNAEQREKLLGYMEKYSSWFDQMNSSGVLQDIQEMQLEFEELKQELAMEFLQWVAENKETIMTIIKGIFEFIKFIANRIIDIVNFFSQLVGGKTTEGFYNDAMAADTINNNNSKSTNITINANTTNNATGILSSQESFDQYNKENFNNLAKQIATLVH